MAERFGRRGRCGNVLEILGREAEAENVYRKGIRVFFDYSDTWVALGIVLAKQVQPPSLYCVWKSDEG